MYKFYIARFTHKKNKLLREEKVNPEAHFLFKGGITHHNEALDRFNPKVNDHYKKDYGDWDIKIWYSQNFETKEEAEEREKDFLEVKFPEKTHKVWLEKALGIKDQYKYSNMSGMTEIRNLTYDEIMETIHQYKQTQSEEEKRLKAILREKHNEK